MTDLILLVIQIIITFTFALIKPILLTLKWIVYNVYTIIINILINLWLILAENVNYKPTIFVKFKEL